jgi:hypothetical protein
VAATRSTSRHKVTTAAIATKMRVSIV